MRSALPAILGMLVLIWVFWKDEPSVKEAIRNTEQEYKYAHDPECHGDRGCQEESYQWHLYFEQERAKEETGKKVLAVIVVGIIVGAYYYSKYEK